MASPDQVKQYLAFWFQLGKHLMVRNGQEAYRPSVVVQGDRYSPEFEACWQRAMQLEGKDCYLEGTLESLDQLLSPGWEITLCARCDVPVPTITLGVPPLTCPCADLPLFPNHEVPPPHLPADPQVQLTRIRDRLLQTNSKDKTP
ncbi:MAG: hypothetical protein MUF49_28590 [Oculatellaceae cyanobacterium Prado106]|jgi:hypothetical protein|nr:hypothetical protein [Oculatellaceae cyanobacterium Prado106]